MLDILEGPFDEGTPIFYPADDPFTLRFHVKAVVWVSLEKTPPIQADAVWHGLSFTQKHPQVSLAWTGHVRGSLTRVSDADGTVFESWLRRQAAEGTQPYPVDTDEYRKLVAHRVRRTDKDVTVTVPNDTEHETTTDDVLPDEGRESIKMQALLAEIGSHMGMQMWIPQSRPYSGAGRMAEQPIPSSGAAPAEL